MRCALCISNFQYAILLYGRGHICTLAALICSRGALCVWPLPWLLNHPLRALLSLQTLAKISLSKLMRLCFPVQALAELLTTNKLSELACLTLYLMYEKKNGKQSVWFEFIKASGFHTCRGHVMARDMHDKQ